MAARIAAICSREHIHLHTTRYVLRTTNNNHKASGYTSMYVCMYRYLNEEHEHLLTSIVNCPSWTVVNSSSLN